MRVISAIMVMIVCLGCGGGPATPPQNPAAPATAPQMASFGHKSSGGGLSLRMGDHEVQAGTHYLESGKPSLFFGQVTPANGEPEVLYLVLYRFPEKSTSHGTQGGPSGNSSLFAIHDRITIDGREFVVELELAPDAETKTPITRNWQINGKPIDSEEGRVFLVDFSADPLSWKPVKLDLKGLSHELGPIDSESAAAKWIAELRERDAVIDEALR